MNRILLVAVFALASAEKAPRLKFVVQEPPRFHFAKPENYMTLYHQKGTDVLYVGGQAVIYALAFTDKGVKDIKIAVALDQNTKDACVTRFSWAKPMCDNFITVIEKVNDTFVVCGTNAGTPKCWLLNNTVVSDVPNGRMTSASDISPPFPSQRSISLSADGNLYSALSAVGGQQGSIRRTYGSSKLLRTESKWLLNPQFAGAAVIPAAQKYKEEIYFFFSEINKTTSVDEQPYRARIGRICMSDEGGLRNLLADSWSTFLKARVMCGSGNTPQQYNNIKQASVLTAMEKRTGIIYGLFSNAWDTTVVCAYSIEDIDQAFSTSRLKGYSIPLSVHRPGTCRNSTTSQHADTLKIIKDHPEIEDVIRPIGEEPLGLPTEDHFTHIVADAVLAVNEEHYSVLYIGTEQGKVLKVLHTNEEAFIISQFSLFHNEGPVLSMVIDSQKGHLYVGTAMEVQRLPLADCSRYGDSCPDCILSRDPYCGWDSTRRKCVAVPVGYNITTGALLQSLDRSNASICGDVTAMKVHSTVPKNVVINSNGPVFLPCPVRSYHATYRWEKDHSGQKHYPCSISGSSCVLAPTPDLPLKEGVFRCMTLENGLKREVVSYRLVFNSAILPTSSSFLGPSLLFAAATRWIL
ncbi:semaphorin-7A isoform X2 [Denticeps clupeoides]|uniref:Semaphorin-1A n=1 Tax=Denticeps clupeoides TaxID=299321 RepID=A0AAY4DQG6_9TELE|nr:semaphorin-7A-like isoform X2 [Denticeps clupeoides]